MVPKLIAITGKAGAGKDTLADGLLHRFGGQKYSFALPLKQMICALLNITMAQLEDRVWREKVLPELGRSPRYLMQTLGTEWGRELVNPDMWINIASMRYMEFCLRNKHTTGSFVIQDCRFDNEAVLVKQLGGIVIEVTRKGLAPVNAHVSEQGIQDSLIDIFVGNNYAPDEMVNDVIDICNTL